MFYITLPILLMCFFSSCVSGQMTHTEEDYTKQFKENDGRIDWIPQNKSFWYGYDNAKRFDKWEVIPDSVLLLRIVLNQQITWDSLYQYSNIIALSFSLPKKSDSEILSRIQKFDFSKFPKLQALSFIIDKSMEKEASQFLSRAKHIKYVNVSSSYRNLVIPEALCSFDRIFNLNIETSSKTFYRSILNIHYPPCLQNIIVKHVMVDDFSLKDFRFNDETLEKTNYRFKKFMLGRAIYHPSEPIIKNRIFSKRDWERNRQHKKFMQSLFSIKSLETIDLSWVYLDSIPRSVGELKQLKKISISNSILSHIPKEIRKLNQLESIKLHLSSPLANIGYKRLIEYRKAALQTEHLDAGILRLEELSKDPNSNYVPIVFPDLYIEGKGGFKGLKKLMLYNIPFVEFPDFSGAKQLEELMFFGDQRITSFPSYIEKWKKLELLIWRRTAISSMPNGLNKLPIRYLQLDDNQLQSIANILDVAAKADYFSYDINDIPFEKRKQYNEHLAQKSGKPFPVVESPEVKALHDRLMGVRNNPVAAYVKKYHFDPNGRERDYKWEERIGESYPNDYGERKDITATSVVAFRNYVQLSDSLNIPIKFITNPVIGFWASEWPFHDFKSINSLLGTYDTLATYPTSWEISNALLRLEPGNVWRYRMYVDYDLGRFPHVRWIKSRGYRGYNQSAFNAYIKAKNLQYLQIGGDIDYIPECFCELQFLTTFKVSNTNITPENLHLLDEWEIKYPTCMQNMKLLKSYNKTVDNHE